MLKHPFSGQPLSAIVIDIRTADADFLKQLLNNRGDKLCLVTLLTHFTTKLRELPPNEYPNAARHSLALLSDLERTWFGQSTVGASKEEPKPIPNTGGSTGALDKTPEPPNITPVAKSLSRKRRGKALAEASKARSEQAASKLGRRSSRGA